MEIDPEKIILTKEEKKLEAEIERGEWKPVSKEEFERIKAIVNANKKDTVLNMRINSQDLKKIKAKAKKLGIPYQKMIGEFLHKIANS